MELSAENVHALAEYLKQTLSPDGSVRREAEKFLESVEGHANYPRLLLHLLENESAESEIRVIAAVTFKNYVKRNWRIIEDHPNRINDADRQFVRTSIIDMMLKMPERIQVQLSEAISIIGREDFPAKWPELLAQLVEKFKNESGNFHVIDGVLRTAHSLFRRYRHELKSQELWTEIKYVLETFAQPITELFQYLMGLAKEHSSNPQSLKIIFSSLTLVCKIFYSLNYQDLPEFFEDNMAVWMDNFLTLLTADNKLLQTDDEDESGPLELIKSQICNNVAMYAQKYDEEFQPYLARFVTAVWELFVTTGPQVKYDMLISNAIDFLASVADRPQAKALFENEETLRNICEKVVLKNMHFRDTDEELFEDNPEEYIRQDLEGSNVDTRRRASCDLVRSLCKYFEGPVTAICSAYVTSLLTKFAENPAENWVLKDASIYLVTSLATKTKTQKDGATKASDLVDITDFYVSHIQPHLQSKEVDEFPVIKADAIKYLTTFRNILPRECLLTAIPHLIHLLQSKSVVVHSYAANCLERLFTLKSPGGTGQPFSSVEIQPVSETLLANLFTVLTKPGSHENEYVMKAVMRSLSMLKEHCVPYLGGVVEQLSTKLAIVAKNPSKPHFNHYLFESICCILRISCRVHQEHVTTFEHALFPVFQTILTEDVSEFLPYIFQLLSLLLEVRSSSSSAAIPDPYMELYPHLLIPALWEKQGNIPPLVRLLQAFIRASPDTVLVQEKLLPLLGVFQKLVASKLNDHEGFYLLSTLIEHIQIARLSDHLKSIFVLLFQRLQSSKTTKYVKGLLVFFCLFAGKHGGGTLVDVIDGIQPKLFGMVIERLFVPDVQKVSGLVERKICAVGMTRILTEASHLLTDEYVKLWIRFLQCLIELFELPQDNSVPEDEHFIEIEDTPGYQAAYSQLVFAGKQEQDPFKNEFQNPKAQLAKSLHSLSLKHPGKLAPLVTGGGLPQEAIQYLTAYLQLANITSLA
ncbi:exportin-2-like [Oscarella lobularis]|uniref:exportin-2-like n=1 Tax=Oscarella lobularis TaxID=121494 RepID=UPI0033136404